VQLPDCNSTGVGVSLTDGPTADFHNASMQSIRLLVIDPLAASRDRLVDALSHRFDVLAVESRTEALTILGRSKGIRLVLVNSFQLEWKGKQLARHISKRLGAACPPIWHYGEVDGCARVSETVASDYRKKYRIDRFLTATLAPVEIARTIAAHFHKELDGTAQREPAVDTRSSSFWTEHISLDAFKHALTTNVVTPLDELPDDPDWNEILRARVNPKNIWKALNKEMLLHSVDASAGMSVREVLLMRVNARNMTRLVTRSYGAHAAH
jgi:hypothetical protein